MDSRRDRLAQLEIKLNLATDHPSYMAWFYGGVDDAAPGFRMQIEHLRSWLAELDTGARDDGARWDASYVETWNGLEAITGNTDFLDNVETTAKDIAHDAKTYVEVGAVSVGTIVLIVAAFWLLGPPRR